MIFERKLACAGYAGQAKGTIFLKTRVVHINSANRQMEFEVNFNHRNTTFPNAMRAIMEQNDKFAKLFGTIIITKPEKIYCMQNFKAY